MPNFEQQIDWTVDSFVDDHRIPCCRSQIPQIKPISYQFNLKFGHHSLMNSFYNFTCEGILNIHENETKWRRLFIALSSIECVLIPIRASWIDKTKTESIKRSPIEFNIAAPVFDWFDHHFGWNRKIKPNSRFDRTTIKRTKKRTWNKSACNL